jgi:ADP-ribose pyrophosphatase
VARGEIAARRELHEETGYEAAQLTYAFEGASSGGLTDERVTFFLATGLTKTGPGGGEGSERIVTHETPIDEAAAWLETQRAAGKDIDLKAYAGLYFAQRAWSAST